MLREYDVAVQIQDHARQLALVVSSDYVECRVSISLFIVTSTHSLRTEAKKDESRHSFCVFI